MFKHPANDDGPSESKQARRPISLAVLAIGAAVFFMLAVWASRSAMICWIEGHTGQVMLKSFDPTAEEQSSDRGLIPQTDNASPPSDGANFKQLVELIEATIEKRPEDGVHAGGESLSLVFGGGQQLQPQADWRTDSVKAVETIWLPSDATSFERVLARLCFPEA
ncbi:MAG TPA: hypothetical protein VMF30_11660, partial [Pirellulales bacterium]|nr:hypothetical protein [Pirellulales bacterium]